MRAKDVAGGLAAFVVGAFLGERIFARIFADLANVDVEAPAASFILTFPKTFLFLGAGPFVLALWAARRRLAFLSVAIPSFVSGFLWLLLYSGASWLAVVLLRMGRPARLSTGLAGLLLIVMLPALVEYFLVFKVYAWLAGRAADPRSAGP